MADTLPALVRICDAEGASIWFNREWLAFRGRSVEEDAGSGWLEGLHPQDAQSCRDLLATRFRERQTYETRYRLRHHSGQYRWVLHRAAPRFNAAGEFLGFITACIDVHEATMAEYERSQFFRVASDILLTSNNDGRIDKISNACERVLGWTAEEMVRTPLPDLLHPDDLARTLATSEILARGEELIDFENRYRHKDGNYRWLSWRGRRDEDTGIVYCSAVDVTKHKAMEVELREAVDRYNLAISATSDGIWDWNVLTDELYVSPRYIEMLGLERKEAHPTTTGEWRSHLHPDDASAATEAYRAYIDGRSPDYKAIFRMRHADGNWRTILSRGIALRDETGSAYRMLGVHADITEQRQMEDNLRLLKDQAEAANRAKSDFLANMSHEIRTPMNAIIGAAQLLGMGPALNDKQEKLVGVLKGSADSLMQLLNDFLDLSKIESGNLDFQEVQFDARHIVTEVLQMLEVQTEVKGLEIEQVNECACVNERLFVGDPDRIRQVLLNLCSNAIKFTDRGRISVAISCRPTPVDDIEDLIFVIKDTGVGIPAEKLEAVFGKFEQADSSVSRKFGGSGLGLAIVKGLVDGMDGTVAASSELGVGSTFTVTLPLRRGPAMPIAANDADEAHPSAPVIPRVLIVEDVPANVYIAERYLDEFGFRHEVATDGIQALDRIVAGETFDAILMDIQMPDMDGRETTRRIRAHEQANGLAPNQIIAVTAHAMVEDRQKCLAAGMDDYITKPFEPKRLEQMLVRAVADRRKSENRFLEEVTEAVTGSDSDDLDDTALTEGA
ncbi:PAS domain-containing protein [Asticcacaulis solisilvae]|uniref:PAS domain-containing protein n=1 Tax=Asticcacaulis solisilvae TaxID=1217274 RepID=UPI003FD8426F